MSSKPQWFVRAKLLLDTGNNAGSGSHFFWPVHFPMEKNKRTVFVLASTNMGIDQCITLHKTLKDAHDQMLKEYLLDFEMTPKEFSLLAYEKITETDDTWEEYEEDLPVMKIIKQHIIADFDAEDPSWMEFTSCVIGNADLSDFFYEMKHDEYERRLANPQHYRISPVADWEIHSETLPE
jgi:hypothetical protein